MWRATDEEVTAAVALPSVDLRSEAPEVWDQKRLPSCSAHAVAAAVEMARTRQFLSDFRPARLFIHYYACRATARGTGGATGWFGVPLRNAIKAAHTYGAPPEPLWPYRVTRSLIAPSKRARDAALPQRVVYTSVKDNDVGQVRASLAEHVPVAFSFLPSPAYEALAKRSGNVVPEELLVPKPGAVPSELKRHANLIVGFDNERGAFLARNSWGARFGDRGHCWIAYEYLAERRLANDFWRVERVGPAE